MVAWLVGCAGKTAAPATDAAPAAFDGATDTAIADSAEDAVDDAVDAAPHCPSYRPVHLVPCSKGLVCNYPCAPGDTTALTATCPDGVWETTSTPCK